MEAKDTPNGARVELDSSNAKLLSIEALYNAEIKTFLEAMPEPYHTYLYKVKKWRAVHPRADISNFSIPKGITNDLNKTRMKLMQLKIGGLREEYGFSSGVKFNLRTVVQAIASGRGLSSRDKPFLRLTSNITHSVTLLIDFSSSMASQIDKVKESVYIFSEVLDRLQLSFGVFGYSEKFWIIKHFNEKWDLDAKSRLFGLEARGMSPEAIAINTAGSMTQNMIDKGKIMFVISDGLFENRLQAKRAVQGVRKSGVVVVGVSTFADVSDVFPANIIVHDDLNEIWAHDSFMRIYKNEFHSEY